MGHNIQNNIALCDYGLNDYGQLYRIHHACQSHYSLSILLLFVIMTEYYILFDLTRHRT